MTFSGTGSAPVSTGYGLTDSIGQTFNPQAGFHAPQNIGDYGQTYDPQTGYQVSQQNFGGHYDPSSNYQAPQQGAGSHGQTYNPQTSGQAPQQNPGNYGQTYDPNMGYQMPQNVSPGPSSSPRFIPSGSGVGWSSFGHSQRDSSGTNEPLLGGPLDYDTPPEYASPLIPPRNPLRLFGGAEDESGGGDVYGDEGGSSGGGGGFDDEEHEYEALKKLSLKIRNNPE